jgi:signal transduction histidine kinase
MPLLMVAAGAYTTLLAPKPPPPVSAGSVDSNLQTLQTQLSAVSSALVSSIQKSAADIATLASNPTDEAFQTFLGTHPGTSGAFMLAEDGRVEKALPADAPPVDAGYAATEEFGNLKARVLAEGRSPYQFFTDRLGYSAFVFTAATPGRSIVGVVLNLESFFSGLDPNNGEVFLLEAGSGRFFHHSNKAKLKDTFNAAQEPWLAKVQEDLRNKVPGKAVNGSIAAAAYYPLGIQAFGLVQVVPYASVAPPPPPAKDIQAVLQENLQTPLALSLVVALAWILLVGSLRLKSFLKPLQDALAVVQRAAGGGAAVTDADLRNVGNDEPGKIVAAAAQWAQRLEGERDAQVKERDDELRRTKNNLTINLEGKTKELGTAAQQLTALKGELDQANQRLADKVKELDAMKGMADGLRGQTEQAKAEIAKLKSRVSGHEEKEGSLQGKLSEADAKLKDMEAKLLKAVSVSSAIQVSQVRVAAIRTMADELKTTLGIIKGYVSSALGSAQGGITEKQQEFLGMVINRSARLEKFINDLMDIYLVEIEQESAPREEVNLASEIEGLAFNFQPQADIKGLKIKVESKGTVPKVPVVRRRFTQLWNILYLQMIKDAPRSATLSIAVEPIGEDVKVSVHDPGLTVKDDHLGKVFDEFYDPKHPASPQLAGTGLKLSLVKTILAAHGGGAVAEKATPGTTLILTFPSKVRKKGEVPAVPKPAAPPPSIETASVKPSATPVAPTPATAPGVKIPTFGMPAAAAPKPAGPTAAATGALEAMLKKGIVPPPMPKPPAPAAPPTAPKPAVPPAPGGPTPAMPPIAPKPVVPPATGGPASAAPAAPPKPAGPAPDLLDSLVGKTAAPPSSAAPKPPAPPPAAPKLAPAVIPGGLDALLAAKPAPPSAAPPAGAVPPPPPAPGTVRPPLPPTPGGAPSPAAATPGAPKVVPTAMKPTPPSAGVLDMNNTDGFKLDDVGASPKPPAPKPAMPPVPAPVVPPKPPIPPPGAPPTAKPPMPPPAAAPKPPAPPPGAPPAGGPIVKDLKKDGGADGELID